MECRKDYFPRKFHYKKDAQALADRIARKGGEAVVVRAKDVAYDLRGKEIWKG
jgi:hypothetical protein